MYANWGEEARYRIDKILAALPPDATLEDKRKALRAASGDFHGGTSWGKKVWPRECRKYLQRLGLPPLKIESHPRFSDDIIFPYRAAP